MGWVLHRWGGSCTGGVGPAQVGWVLHRWGGSCTGGVGPAQVGWGGSCTGTWDRLNCYLLPDDLICSADSTLVKEDWKEKKKEKKKREEKKEVE